MTDIGQSLKSIGPVPFWKMNGSGNDFVVVDNRNLTLPETLKGEWARRVCRPRLAIGSDGVVLIETLTGGSARAAEPANFRWRYFNADGSEGEMCGNGAMCGARFAIDQEIAPNPCTFETQSGIVRAELRDTAGMPVVWLDIPDTGALEIDVHIDLDGECLSLHDVTVGVPHVVLVVDDADSWPSHREFHETGAAIRRHPQFAPAGTNVNVISLRDDGSLRMRTYERGVEAETLACGTGAVASSAVATTLGLVQPPVTVRTSSGYPLHVEFVLDDLTARDVRLGGNAMLVASGVVLPDALEESPGG